MAKRILACLMLLVMLIGLCANVASAATLKYWVGVDLKSQRTTVYSTVDNSVVHRFICSTGAQLGWTPQGTFKMSKQWYSGERKEWYQIGGIYVKYASRITGRILFHSILYNSKSDARINKESVNKLGSPASHGCVRLMPSAAQWIARNCPPGTTVVIHYGVSDKRITKILGQNAGTELTPTFDPIPEVKSVTLDHTGTVSLDIGQTLQLSCTILPEEAAVHETPSWSSSVKNIAKVDANGLVTALKEGTVTISAKAFNGKKGTVKIRVVDPTKATRVELDQSGTVMLPLAGTLQLNAAMQPDTAISTLKWTSSETKYAAVDQSGLVTALKEGTTTVTVRTNTKKTDTVKVKVYDPAKPAKIELAQTGTVPVDLGTTLQLNAVVTNAVGEGIEPAKASVWSTSAKKIATVSADGVVTPVKEGTVTVTVKTYNGKTDTVKVKVVDPKKPTSIALDQSGTVTLNLGDTLTLNAAMQPDTAESEFKWSSSDKKIAAVADGVVTPVKEGTVTVTVKTYNGKTDTVKVKIVDPKKPTSVALDQSGTVMLALGDTLTLNAQMQPATAESELKWSSSDKKIATVSGGVVSPIKPGTVTVTVKTAYNGRTDTVKVKVYDPSRAAKVTLAESGTLRLNLGETLQLNVAAENIVGEDVTALNTFKWTSSDKKIAAVDAGGVVTPVKTGTVTVTVKAPGGKSDTVKVKVVDPTVATKITIDQGKRIKVAMGDDVQLTAVVQPATAVTSVKWLSHSQKYAKINSRTGEVTLLRTGEAKISVRTGNGKEDVIYLDIVKGSAAPAPASDLPEVPEDGAAGE